MTSKRQQEIIHSAQQFVRVFFPNAPRCPHCNGTGMQHGLSLTRRPKTRDQKKLGRA
jgi:hypothetical protein